jgi:nicotinamidase/pyrazinamidase
MKNPHEKIKILDIGDMQNGFMREEGTLYIPGARDIISPADRFLNRVAGNVFDYTFIVLDTHFAEEYDESDESDQFPLHCEYGTDDWELAVDTTGLPNIRYLMKNRFDMWSGNSREPVPFRDPKRKTTYENLFHFTGDPHLPYGRAARDDFLRDISPGQDLSDIEVTLIGVASDYCIRFALEGWLARGASVTIVHDLTRGIGKEMREVLGEERYRHFRTGRLRSVDSAEYLRDLAV